MAQMWKQFNYHDVILSVKYWELLRNKTYTTLELGSLFLFHLHKHHMYLKIMNMGHRPNKFTLLFASMTVQS